MPDTLTTNYNWIKPEVGASKTTWGNKWNDNLTNIDAKMKEAFDAAINSLQKSGGTVTGNIELTAVPTLLAHLVNAKWAYLILQQVLPLGQIMIWYGSIASIPVGWSLCDGGTYNGLVTPNLGGRFVLATTGSNPIGELGGAWTTAVSGTVGSHVLTYNEMAYHTHGATTSVSVSLGDTTHTHGVNDPGHAHTYTLANVGGGGFGAGASYQLTHTGTATSAAGTGIYLSYSGSGAYIAGASGSTSIAYAGANWGHDHTWSGSVTVVPMYCALAYIMRTSWPWAPVTP